MEQPSFHKAFDLPEPGRALPEDLDGRRIALRITGGVGDVIMAVGGTAYALKQSCPSCHVTAAVMEHHIPLLKQMEGVDVAVKSTVLNDPVQRATHEVILELGSVFHRKRQLKEGGYYKLLSQRVGVPVGPGKFKFQHEPEEGVLGLHPGASNPNRRWEEDKWEGIIEAAVLRGLRVLVFGTRVEWTMHAPPHVISMCEETDDLLWQAEQVARCQFFIGCDSGFAHVAGVLGVPGDVLFFSTHPKDVIDRYQNLNGIHAFQQEPTRSLNKEDEAAAEARAALDVPTVVNECKWGKLTQTRTGVKLAPEHSLRRYKLLVIAGGGSPIVGDLRTFCDVRCGAQGTAELAAADLVVVVHQRGTMVRHPEGSAPWLYLNEKIDPEAARRAVREILARGKS